MKGSRKLEPPVELHDWLNKENEDWKPEYPFDDPQVKEAVRAQLYREQRGLCVYCGRKLNMSAPGKTFHLEHFRPQTMYPERAVAHENLFLSCGQHDPEGKPSPTCGNRKGDWFDELNHIYPSYDGCTQRFRFMLDGSVVAATDGDASATEMIKRLNLDHLELVKDRADILSLIDAEKLDLSDFWDEGTGTGESFAHMVFQHRSQIIP